MPIPFYIRWNSVSSGGAYGVKKGIDAKDDFDTARNI